MSIADKLTTVAENVPKVYEAGKKAEYDDFWKAYQSNGNRTVYQYAFYRQYWKNGTTYNPKYPITIPSSNYANNMFANSGVTNTEVAITISGSHAGVFSSAAVKTIPYLDVSGVTGTMADWFTSCSNLAHITFVGTISVNVNFKDCPLTAKSLVSIVEHLSDTASGKTLTVKTSAVNNADWSTTDYASWDALIATKPNWSFSKA